ncbi:hypothetical protein FHS86_003557 [Roseimarinus sediminis]
MLKAGQNEAGKKKLKLSFFVSLHHEAEFENNTLSV